MRIINYIQILQNSGHVTEALEDINKLVKLLMSEVNHDKIIYIIAKFLNKIMATTSPKLRDNACLNFNENLE